MRRCRIRGGLFLTLLALGLLGLRATPARAQLLAPSGVMIDAEGVLRRQVFNDPNGALAKQRIAAAKASLSKDVQKQSPLRLVSLNRLEAAIVALHGKQQQPNDEMLHLAGLTRVKYVFYYPESKDIVIAGPAEGWAIDLVGRAIGLTTGRPVVELQDLVVALRAYAPEVKGKNTKVIMCSIDPTQEGLQRMSEYLASFGGVAPLGDEEAVVAEIRTRLGMQNIRVGGVSPKSHFAQVLVEADYRMKLIGLGMERPSVKLASYVERANLAEVGANALQRWMFEPDYQCVRVAADDLGMELIGNGVKLVGENQMVGRDGSRQVTSHVNKASQAFVDGFTRKYADIAARTPVYAQLRNCIDLAVAAAFIQQHDYYGKSGWKMTAFGDEKVFPVETYNVPEHVEATATLVRKGGRIGFPNGGGVHIEPRMALNSTNLLEDESGAVEEAREKVDLSGLAEGQWWWDGK